MDAGAPMAGGKSHGGHGKGTAHSTESKHIAGTRMPQMLKMKV